MGVVNKDRRAISFADQVEPAAPDSQQMIRPLAEVRHSYVPHFAVDHRLDTCAFAGCVLDTSRGKRQR